MSSGVIADNNRFSGLVVLVVEDNDHMMQLIKGLLRGFGVAEVVTATSTSQAEALLGRKRIDIVLLDYMVGPVDGVQFARNIRTAAGSPHSDVPIIMITAFSDRARVEAARDAGVSEFLRKPLSARDLYLRLVSVVENPRPMIRSGDFAGPDRRRHGGDEYSGPERRRRSDDRPGRGGERAGPDVKTGKQIVPGRG